jgi:hypothetical protein
MLSDQLHRGVIVYATRVAARNKKPAARFAGPAG